MSESENPVDFQKFERAKFRDKSGVSGRLITVWNIIDQVLLEELRHQQSKMDENEFLEKILGKNIQKMIFIFKRTIENDMKKFFL